MDESGDERRAAPRFPIDFVLDVSVRDTEGIAKIEKTKLKDFSTGGARFVTIHPDWYKVYQKLNIRTYLPGGDGLNALMKGIAKVQRIAISADSDGEPKWEVAITIEDPLDFERKANLLSGKQKNRS